MLLVTLFPLELNALRRSSRMAGRAPFSWEHIARSKWESLQRLMDFTT